MKHLVELDKRLRSGNSFGSHEYGQVNYLSKMTRIMYFIAKFQRFEMSDYSSTSSSIISMKSKQIPDPKNLAMTIMNNEKTKG